MLKESWYVVYRNQNKSILKSDEDDIYSKPVFQKAQ